MSVGYNYVREKKEKIASLLSGVGPADALTEEHIAEAVGLALRADPNKGPCGYCVEDFLGALEVEGVVRHNGKKERTWFGGEAQVSPDTRNTAQGWPWLESRA